MNKSTNGFTIVELLIVIVVIAILAAISIVAYNGIQNRAYDTAVQNDLTNLGKKIELYKITNPNAQYPHPVSTSELRALDAKLSTHAYSAGYVVTTIGEHNLLYCRAANNERFALIAWSKSGNGFVFTDGATRAFEQPPASLTIVCPAAGIPDGVREWIYHTSSWRI